MDFENIRLPAVMRTTPMPPKPENPKPVPILGPDCIESVAAQTPIDLLETLTGADIAAEFTAKRKAADEAICRDILVYLVGGLTPAEVIELVWLRRGAEFGVTKEKVERAVFAATNLLAKQKQQKQEKSNGP